MDAKIVVEHGDKKLCAIHRTCGSESKALVIMAHGGPGGDKRGPLGLFDILAESLTPDLGSRVFASTSSATARATGLRSTSRSDRAL